MFSIVIKNFRKKTIVVIKVLIWVSLTCGNLEATKTANHNFTLTINSQFAARVEKSGVLQVLANMKIIYFDVRNEIWVTLFFGSDP